MKKFSLIKSVIKPLSKVESVKQFDLKISHAYKMRIPQIFYVSQSGYINDKKPDNILCLNPSPIESHLSILRDFPGTWTPRQSFYDNESTNHYTVKTLYKFIGDVLSGKPIYDVEDLGFRITKFLRYSKSLNIKEDIFYAMGQHISTSLLTLTPFTKETLYKITNNCVNFESFKHRPVTSQNIIEAHVLNESLGEFIQNNKTISVFAQNHKNFSSGDYLIDKDLSYKLTSQPHADWKFVMIDQTDHTNMKTIFYDVKLKTDPLKNVPLFKGSLSLTTYLDKQLFITKFKGDFKYVIYGKAKENLLSPEEIKVLNDYYSEVENNLNSKSMTLNKKNEYILGIQKKIDLDIHIKSIVCSRITCLEDTFSEGALLVEQMENSCDLEEISNKIDVKILFPADGKTINVIEWKTTFDFLIDSIPEHLIKNSTILENKNRLKELGYYEFF